MDLCAVPVTALTSPIRWLRFCVRSTCPLGWRVGCAQFVSPPPGFHTVVEAFVGGQWLPFDLTRLSPASGRVRMELAMPRMCAFVANFGAATTRLLAPNIQRVDRGVKPA